MDDFGWEEPMEEELEGEEPEDFDEEDFADREFGASPAGGEMLFVIWAIDVWLENAPGGPLSLFEHHEAHLPVEAFIDGWNSGILQLLAPSPLTATELGLALDTLSHRALRKKLAKLCDRGLIEARPGDGEGAVYAVTDWLREAVGPLLVAVRCEMRTSGDPTGPSSPGAVETAFLLALPLLELPAEAAGRCRLLVDLPESDEQRAGAMVHVEDGRVASCSVSLEGSADSWAIGPASAWVEAVVEGKAAGLELGGEGNLARTVIESLHTRQFPKKTY
jgi:DNA-binding transcriptional ArsR family regulator